MHPTSIPRSRRGPLPAAAAALLAASGIAVPQEAAASPPSGPVTKIDHRARALVAEGASIRTPAGTGVAVASYDLPGSAGTGWRTLTGTAVVAVTGGALDVTAADGCATRALPAGGAAVLPPGRVLIANAGDGPSAFTVVLLGAPGGGADALGEPSAEAAPKGCATAGAARSDGPVAAAPLHATLVPAAAYGGSSHAPGVGAVAVEGGRDVNVSTYTLGPGFSSGWARHQPTVTLVTRGALTYYEDHHGSCARAGHFSAGQAFVHTHRHAHLAAVEGAEPAEVTFVTFNVAPGGTSAVPLAGNIVDTVDFTPLPPAGCPRLR